MKYTTPTTLNGTPRRTLALGAMVLSLASLPKVTEGQESARLLLADRVDRSALPALNASSDYRDELAQQHFPPSTATAHFPRTTSRSLYGGAAISPAPSIRRKTQPIRSLFDLRRTESHSLESEMTHSAESSGRTALSTTTESVPPRLAVSTAPIRKKSAEKASSSIGEWKNTHIGVCFGRAHFLHMDKLNEALSEVGSNPLKEQSNRYTFFNNLFVNKNLGVDIHVHYFPKMTNGDRFDIRHRFTYSVGPNYTFGYQFFHLSSGINLAVSKVKLIERFDNSVSLLMQSAVENRLMYTNDMFLIEPHLSLYLNLPVVGFHFRAEYNLDVSGKHWRVGGKLRDFSKTSFSSFSLQAGLSFHFSS